ncbi:hypothetical protein D3C72_2249780 [compost metagenome]
MQPSARNSAALREARRKAHNSPITDLKASFLVVTAGKLPLAKSKRIMAPGTLRVRMPVRLSCQLPVSSTVLIKS